MPLCSLRDNSPCITIVLITVIKYCRIYAAFVALPDEQSDSAVRRCKELGLPALERMIDSLDKEYGITTSNESQQHQVIQYLGGTLGGEGWCFFFW
jgi:hypothetical protein